MYWERKAVMEWVEQYDNPYYPPHKRRRVDSGFGVDDEPRYDYDPEFASVVDDSMLVEVDHGTETIPMEEKKAWYFRDVHWDMIEPVSLNIVECGKWVVNQMEYSHAERVIHPVDDVAQLAYPMPPEVPSYKWYPNLLRPQDGVRSRFTLVANCSQIIMDLKGIPEDD